MRQRSLRLVTPAMLLVVGLWLLQGCLFIPTFNKVDSGGHNAAADVGEADSKKPLRVGTATIDDVSRILGRPTFVNPDGSAVAYRWGVTNGIWIWPLCFQAYAQEGKRMLVVEFDHAGVLRSFHVEKTNGNWLYSSAPFLGPPKGMKPWSPNLWPEVPPAPAPVPPSVPPHWSPPPGPASPLPPPGPRYRIATPSPGGR